MILPTYLISLSNMTTARGFRFNRGTVYLPSYPPALTGSKRVSVNCWRMSLVHCPPRGLFPFVPILNIHVGYTMFVIVVWIYYAFTSGGQWLSFVLIYTALFASAIEVGFLEKSSLLVICNEIIADFDKNNRKAHIS